MIGRGATRAMMWAAALALLGLVGPASGEGDDDAPVARNYVQAPAAMQGETQAQADKESVGCKSCHTETDSETMHQTPAVVLGCTACHGGDASIIAPPGLAKSDPQYAALRDSAHVLPRYPQDWKFPSAANPKESYTLLNREAPEFIRFVNPSDYRVVRESCGACHLPIIQAAERSLMATGAMFFGGAAYNNGVLPDKNYILGEAYTRDGLPAKIVSPGAPPGTLTDAQKARGALAALYPLPTWEVVPPADIFRVFERGGISIGTQFPDIGLPDESGNPQTLEEPGKPDIRQSKRGMGTGLRVAIPVLNIHKTRLNDPFMWFMGTNDQPGDYRQSGCAACHVIYANDREPRDSLSYSQYGRDGTSASADPTIARDEPGHPIKHQFTRDIPTSQCMACHMHQPNMFLNSYLGYTMWDYESEAPFMWPEQQKYPTAEEVRKVLDRDPEGAAPRGNWADLDFLRKVVDLNPKLKETQFADYHGHGWNFRGVYKRDRDGNLLDAKGDIIPPDDPEKWRRKGEGKWVPPGINPGKDRATHGHSCRERHAMRRLPFRAG